MRQIVPAGDHAVLVKFGDTMSPETLSRVLAFDAALGQHKPRGLISTVPAYGSLLCTFDPDAIAAETLQRELENLPITDLPARAQTVHIVPVRYDGPDLERVADHAGLSTADVIATHASVDYPVSYTHLTLPTKA